MLTMLLSLSLNGAPAVAARDAKDAANGLSAAASAPADAQLVLLAESCAEIPSCGGEHVAALKAFAATGDLAALRDAVHGATPADAQRWLVDALDDFYGRARAQVPADARAAFDANRARMLATVRATAPHAASATPPAVHAKLSGTTVKGALPPEVVMRLLRGAAGDLKACAANADLDAREKSLVFAFTIDAQGKVRRFAVQPASTLAEPAVRACLQKVLEGVDYPEPESGTVEVASTLLLHRS